VSISSFVSLVHLGCARNLIDSELILARLAEEDLIVSGDPELAHTVVLNTCSFIGPAREESYAALQGLLERKAAGEIQAVVVAGCLVQRYKRALAEEFPEVDLFAEISDYRELARSVRRLMDGERLATSYLDGPGLRPPEREGARLLSTPASYAYLRISHGCDHSCAFCAIPAIRGPHRSKPIEALREEAAELVATGVRELVLVSEDSTAWGRDIGLELPRLIEALAELDGDFRLRLMYAYPNRFPWELTPLLRDHDKVVPYLDIPVQHSSSSVLRAMGRAGSGEQVRRTLDRLFEEVPGITLRSTLLVGFPGETDADFEDLLAFTREYRLGRMGAFVYSREEGTPAADLEDTVSAELAEERLGVLLAVRDEVLGELQRAWIDETVEVLVDEAPGAAGIALGHTAMDAPEVDPVAFLSAPDAAVGDRRRGRVEGVTDELNLVVRT